MFRWIESGKKELINLLICINYKGHNHINKIIKQRINMILLIIVGNFLKIDKNTVIPDKINKMDTLEKIVHKVMDIINKVKTRRTNLHKNKKI